MHQEFMNEMAHRLRQAAQVAGENPLALLREGFAGSSPDGSVTVWTNAAGQIKRVRIAPGSIHPGGEKALERAVFEAAREAIRSATEILVSPRIHPREGTQPPPQVRTPIPHRTQSSRPAPRVSDDDFDDRSFLRG